MPPPAPGGYDGPGMDDLRQLISDDSVWADLERTETLLLEAATSEDDYLTKIAQHLLLAGGKRFRPLLALLSARFGPARRRSEAPRRGGGGAHPRREPLPRRRDRRGGHTPGRSLGERQLVEHGGDPRRRLPHGPSVGGRRDSLVPGVGSPAGRHLCRTGRGSDAGAAAARQPRPFRGGLRTRDRRQDGFSDPNLGPTGGDGIRCRRRRRWRPSRRGRGSSGWCSRSSTTPWTSSPPRRRWASRLGRTSAKARSRGQCSKRPEAPTAIGSGISWTGRAPTPTRTSTR